MSGTIILDVFLCVGGLAIAAMMAIALYGRERPLSQGVVTSKGYAIRRWWFGTIITVAAIAFVVSIPRFPYASADTQGKHIAVVAQQYGFMLPAKLPADTPIVFDVTSRDVNHGFGIYDPHGRLIAQVQAMPDYTNHLPITFKERGHYSVRCLEFCGIAHAAMQGGFDVL